ncbi:MAG: helix-turn-helix transcriptional regulator [Clostridia bacterium]|nr:helix-turn-helix transcriptional regulator [Clostridia bacterium]
MAPKTILGNKKLGGKIRSRRNELGLTIEEAASRAGVGCKTWSRYEAGESIRQDKCKGICKALNWHSLPDQEAWSPFLEHEFGTEAAMSFAAGSDMLLDHIQGDMTELASMPVGTHVGQLKASYLSDILPKQFLMHYNYEFLYQMKCALLGLRACAESGSPMIAHSVLEELLLYLCCEEAFAMMELNGEEPQEQEWEFDLFDDMDVVTCLYSDMYLDADHTYHFSHWTERQFYRNKGR